jgi:hypothetical protein
MAADWSWQPAMEWRVDHQSNRLLSAAQEEASQATWLSFDAAIIRATANTELTLRPHVELQHFNGDRALDSEDGSLQLGGRWLREYSELAASAAISRSSTLTTELAETGIVDVNTRRELRNASVSWKKYFSREMQLYTQLGFTDVGYPDAQNSGLVDYRYPNASLSLVRQLSAYTSWSLTASGSKVDAPAVFTTSRDIGLQIGMTRALSPALRVQVSAGSSETQRTNLFETRSDRSQVWDAQLSRTLEAGQWNLSLARSLTPNGRGVLARRDEASVSMSQTIAPQFSGSLSLHAVRNAERAVGLFANEEYRYLSAEAALNRNLSQNWIVALRLGGNNAQRRLADTDAQGWYAALALRWTPALRPIRDWDFP